MEIALLKEAVPRAVPLPLYTSILIGRAKNKEGKPLSLYIGLDAQMVERLKHLSLDTSDTDLQENTSDLKRFGEGSYEEWYAKERVPFALVDDASSALAALAWFGPKPLARKSLKHLSEEEAKKEGEQETGDWHTIVFRSYPPFRGTGIMKEFVRMTIEVYEQLYPSARLWAGIARSNAASIALASKLGFTIDESLSDPSWVCMVK